MTCLKSFINDLNANDSLKKYFPGIGPESWAGLVKEAAYDSTRIYKEYPPPAGWNDQPFGVKVSYYNDNEGVGQVAKILDLLNGDRLLLSYNGQVGIYSSDWVYKGYIPFGRYANPFTEPDGYRYVWGGDINADNTKLALVMYGHDCVRVFNYTTGAVLWTFGDGINGNAEDDRLYNPYDAVWLPNGNLLVSSYNGTGEVATGSNNYGFVVELDGTTGAVVEIRLEYGDNLGYCKRDECMYPTGLGMWGDHAYVCCVGRDEIGRFLVDSDNFDWVSSYKKPVEINADGVNATCVCEGPDNTLVAYATGLKAIAALDIDTGGFRWFSGIPGWDARSAPSNEPHELWDVKGLIYDAVNGVTLVADYGNRRIMALIQNNNATITYTGVEAPDGYFLEQAPPGYDPPSTSMIIPVNKVSQQGSANIPGGLVLGWKREVE